MTNILMHETYSTTNMVEKVKTIDVKKFSMILYLFIHITMPALMLLLVSVATFTIVTPIAWILGY